MSVSDWNKIGTAQRGKIVTCDPESRRVEAQLKDSSVVQVAIWETGVIFRWPQVDEVWTLNRIGGFWRLGIPVDITSKTPIESLDVGDVRIEAPGKVIFDQGTKPTITGSRGGNAALASLISAGVQLGLWTDSTTA